VNLLALVNQPLQLLSSHHGLLGKHHVPQSLLVLVSQLLQLLLSHHGLPEKHRHLASPQDQVQKRPDLSRCLWEHHNLSQWRVRFLLAN
jgi:hypothetical protein